MTQDNHFAKIMTIISLHTSKNGEIKDPKRFLEVINDHKNDFQNAMYFREVAKDPFDANRVLDYIKNDVIPELLRGNK